MEEIVTIEELKCKAAFKFLLIEFKINGSTGSPMPLIDKSQFYFYCHLIGVDRVKIKNSEKSIVVTEGFKNINYDKNIN